MLNTSDMTYSKERKEFIEEHSTLRGNGSIRVVESYVGTHEVVVVKSKSGKEVFYTKSKTFWSAECEITHWMYQPHWNSEINVPECKGINLIVLND